MKRLVALADDLSGAAETAAKIMAHCAQNAHFGSGQPGARSKILLLGDRADVELLSQALVLVVDTDNRRRSASNARKRLDAVLAHLQDPGRGQGRSCENPAIFLKVDSLLRGNIPGQLEPLVASGPVVFAPALPELKRHTVDGVVVCDGIPLADTGLWHIEGAEAPASVAAALHPLRSQSISLAEVRGDVATLSRRMDQVGAEGAVVVCDAETQDDLDAVARAALTLDGVLLAGSSALGAALGCALWGVTSGGEPATWAAVDGPTSDPGDVKVCVVVGTASLQGRAQLQILADEGYSAIMLDAQALLSGDEDSGALRQALAAGTSVVSLSPAVLMPEAANQLSAALAAFVAEHLSGHRLLLTGGETARAVLDAMGTRELNPLFEIEHGAILSQTDQGSLVVTRPGSFGDEESLLHILRHLHSYAIPDLAPMPSGQGKGSQ